MSFEFIDQIEQVEAGRIVVLKTVRLHAAYLKDHFPQFPILPGVLMLETMLQAAEKWIQHQRPAEAESPRGTWVLQEARNIKYGQMVQPGQTLKVEVSYDPGKSIETDGPEQVLAFRGKGEVDGATAVSGRFTMVRCSPQLP